MAEPRGRMLQGIATEDTGKRLYQEIKQPQAFHESATSKKIVVRAGDTLSETVQSPSNTWMCRQERVSERVSPIGSRTEFTS